MAYEMIFFSLFIIIIVSSSFFQKSSPQLHHQLVYFVIPLVKYLSLHWGLQWIVGGQ